MFYSQFILAKKGPLGTIWIAAHLERKLRKNQVAETDIGVTVDNILFPEVPIALRLSGHLLLGVVRIYSRQVNYLFNDCSETLGKIKQAFHSAAVDLPPEATTAPFHSITLPETFDFDELELAPDSEASFLHLNGKYVDHHVTTREQITLQDCIENNPYLGSSQFGLDERFGDGTYSSLGLDFDEEFWTSKAGSSSFASTSTPLLKENTNIPPSGGEIEATQMDVDDPYEQPSESELRKGKSIQEAVNPEAGLARRDDQLNTSMPANSLVPLNEPAGLEIASRKDPESAALKHETPGFCVYTPRVLEACTPDLNQEYCPPAEPSTPALADETAFPLYKACNPESAGPFSPVMPGNSEKTLPMSASPQQVSCAVPWASSVQAIKIPSSASFQGFPQQQAAPVEANREAFVTEKERVQILLVKETAASASTSAAFQSFPEPTLMQQTRTTVSHEGAIPPAGTSHSFLTSPEPSLPSLHQRNDNLTVNANHQAAGTVNQDVYPCLQQQGVATGAVSSFGAMVESSISQPPSVIQNIVPSPVPASPFVSKASVIPSFSASSGSLLPTENLPLMGGVENMNSHKEASHVSLDSGASNSMYRQPATHQLGMSQPPSIMQNTVASQVLASPSVPEASVIPSFSASSVSLLPTANVPLMGGVENVNLHKETSHVTLESAASSSLIRQPPAQQLGMSQPPSIMRNIVASQVLASPSVPEASVIPLFPASSGSLFPTTYVPLMGGVEKMNSGKEDSHVTLDLAASNSLFRQPAAQQLSVPQPPIVASQKLASPSVPEASVIPSFSGSSGGFLPTTNAPLMGGVENMNSDKEASHVTLDPAASKSLFWQPAAQQLSMLQPASQVLTSPFVPEASVIPSFSASSGSLLPITNVPLMGDVENISSDKEASHKALDSAASKSPLWQPAAQELSISQPPPSIMRNIVASQVLASPSVSEASVTPLGSASSESLLPNPNVPVMGGGENMNLDKDSAASQSLFRQSAAQQLNMPQPPNIMRNIVASRVLASPFLSEVSVMSSISASSGSLLSTTNVPLMGGVEKTNSDKEALHETRGLAAPKNLFQQPAAQQLSMLQPPSIMQNIMASQVLTSPVVSKASVIPSFSASAGSLLPITNAPLMGGVEKRFSDKEASHETLSLAASKSLFRQPDTQQPSLSQPPSIMQNIVASQGLASPFVSKASVIPPFAASSGSLLPLTNAPLMGGMGNMNSVKEASHETLNSAASKSLFQQPAAQQLSMPQHAAMPGMFSPMNMGECETLRSVYNLQAGSSGFSMPQRDMSGDRIPGLELERNKSLSVGSDRIMTKSMLPTMDKTPILREETPYMFTRAPTPILREETPNMFTRAPTPILREETPNMFTRAPFLPTHSINSLPADDDVLASILGRRSKAFDVVSTPKAPKEPKLNAAKRPKRAPRVTPKKRKIEFDTVAVLHGDVIRQQLASAEDIRRERHKAPCTRREVWGFIREIEGQENFDEPTLPELAVDLHDLYHDVLHGPESRPLPAALHGVAKANQTSHPQLIRSGESDCLAGGVNNDANVLDPRGDSDHLVECVNMDSSKDVCTNEFVGSGEKNLSENIAGQSEHVKLEIAQINPCGGSMAAEDVEKLHVEEISKPEVDSEELAGKESDTNALLDSKGPEDRVPPSIISRETEAKEQGEQRVGLDQQVEGTGQAHKDILFSSLSEKVVGDVGADVGDEGIAVSVQKDGVNVVGADAGDEGIAMSVQKEPVNVVGDEGIAMPAQKDGVNVVGANVGYEGIPMSMHKDGVNVLGADGGDEGIALSVQRDGVYVVGANVGYEGIAMSVQKDGVNVMGADAGDEGISMSVQKDGVNVVGADVGYEGIPMSVQTFVCADVGYDGISMSVQKDGVDVVGADVGDEGITTLGQMHLVNVVGANVGNQERAMAVQQDTEILEGKQQFSVEVNEHEGEGTLLGKEADFRTLDVPSDKKDAGEVLMHDGNDASEVLIVQEIDIDNGNVEGSDKLPTSNVSEEERNLCKDEDGMAAMECEKETDFLDEDNDVAYAEIDYSSDEQDASIQDSNGWSARSRNVGRFLKTLFQEMEGNSKRLEQGPTLGLERLLARKTKREAARMFFETLVLKTKDYIQVEQNTAYQDIQVYPKSKLMKTEF